MAEKPMGTLFTEVDLDLTKAELKLVALNKRMVEGATKSEEAFKTLGISSDRMFQAQKETAMAAYNAIKNKATSTADDIVRAEQAKAMRIAEINRQQYGIMDNAVNAHSASVAGLTRKVLAAYAAYYVLSQGINATFGNTVRYMSTIETSGLGMAAAYMTGGKYVDEMTGKILKGEAAFKAAQQDTKNVMLELQKANFETIATLDQLIKGYQLILPVALAKGFDKKQVLEFTKSLVQAAGAIDPMLLNQLGEESRALLTGSISDKNSRIATILGIRPEDIKSIQGDADKLYSFLMDKLNAYTYAGMESQKTWAGLWSNTADIALMAGSRVFQPLFDQIKYELTIIQSKILDIDQATGKVKGFKPEFLESITKIKDGVVTLITDFTRLGMLLDKIGGTMTAIGNVAAMTILNKGMSDKMKEWNKMFEERYKASDKSLMDMAMRGEGWSPATGKQIAEGKNLTQVAGELGQIYTYYKGINEEKTKYVNNPIRTDPKTAKATQEWVEIQRALTAELEKTALTSNKWDDKLIAINKRYQDILDKAKGIGGETPVPVDKGFLDNWKAKMTANVEAERQKEITQFEIKSEEERLKRQEHFATEYEKIFMDISHKRGTTNAEALSKIEKDEEKALSKITELELASYWDSATNRKKDVISYEEAERLKEDVARASYARRVELEAKNAAIYVDYMRTAAGQFSAVYEETYKSQLENMADQERLKVEATGREFDREAWLNSKRLDFDAQQLESKANYYRAVEGMEAQSLAFSLAAIEAIKKADMAKGMSSTAANAKAAQAQRDAMSINFDQNTKYVNQSIGNLEKMFDNASQLYDKDSKEYKALQDAKKAMQIAELAMVVWKNVQILAGYMATSGAAATAGTAVNSANTSTAITGAAASIAAQGAVPGAGFAMVAAMTAIMAAVLGAAGIAFGGGSEASVAIPDVLPKSTVLGAENGTASESISKSWELMQDTYDMEYRELHGIYNEMRDLNSNITGLVRNIIMTGGITAAGMTTFTALEGTMKDLVKSAAEMFSATAFGSKVLEQIPVIGDMFKGLFGMAENLAGTIASKMFGGETSYRYTGVAVQLDKVSIKELIDGIKMAGRTARGVRVAEDGGWFGDDTYTYLMQYGKLDEAVASTFTLVFKNLSQTLVSLGEGLGGDMNRVLGYVFEFPDIGDLEGTAEQVNEKISAWINQISDQAVASLFGGLVMQYQKIGEGLYETAMRLLVDKEVVLDTLSMVGKAYIGTARQAVALAEDLIYLAGNLENVRNASEMYYDKFFTDAEKQTRLQGQLAGALEDVGKTLPDTREGYRAMVGALNLNTAAGREAYVTMMMLAESADTYYSTIEDLAKETERQTEDLAKQTEDLAKQRLDLEIQLMKSADALAARRRQELAAIDETLRPLQELIYLTEDWAKKLAEATNTTSTAINAQLTAARDGAAAARSAAKAYRDITNSLTEAIEKIRGTTRASATEKFGSVYQKAMTGDQTALSALPGAADSLLSASLATAHTAEEYARDQGKTLIALERASVISTAMTNWEEYQATLLEAEVGVLEDIKEELAKTDPNTEILAQQAGLLSTVNDLLQQQTKQIVAGNGEQVLVIQDQTGKIILANQLYTDQAGQTALGNSWLAGISTGVIAEGTAITQEMSVITEKIVTGALNINTSLSVAADLITESLGVASRALISNDKEEVAAARAAIAILEQTTKDGLITATEAKATTDAIAAMRVSTTNLLAQEILETNKAISNDIFLADNAVLSTLKVRDAVTSGASFSATTIGGYLSEVEKTLVGNSSTEGIEARKAINTLKTVIADGLIKTAEAAPTQKAISTLQTVMTGFLNQSVEAEKASLSTTSTQAADALKATIGVQDSIKYGAKFSADTVGIYLMEVEAGLNNNNSVEAKAARDAIAVLRDTIADGLIKTTEAKATKDAIATMQASTALILNQALVAQQTAYSAEAVQMAEATAKIEKVATAVTSGAAFSSSTIGAYLKDVERYLINNNSVEAAAGREAIGVLMTTTKDGLIATADAESTTGALSSLQGAMTSLLTQSVALGGTSLSYMAKQAQAALEAAIKIEKSIADSTAAAGNKLAEHLTTIANEVINNNTAEGVAVRDALATLKQTTADGFITTAEAKATTSALDTLRTSAAMQSDNAIAAAKAIEAMIVKDHTTTITVGPAIESIIKGQTTEIINGNLLIKDQTGKIISTNALLTDHTGLITLGNQLTEGLVSQVITGNTKQDVITNILNLNTTYTKEMLDAMLADSPNQTHLGGILEANNKTVSLLQQLIDLTDVSRQEKWITEISVTEKKLLELINSVSVAWEKSNAATKNIGVVRDIATKETKATAVAEAGEALKEYKRVLSTLSITASYKETAESLSAGQAFKATGYVMPTGVRKKAELEKAYNTYMKEFGEAYQLRNYVASNDDPAVAAAIVTATIAAKEWQAAKANRDDTQAALDELMARYGELYGEVPSHATGLTRVPYDNYLMRAHEDEAVLTAPQADEWRTGQSTKESGNNVILIEEVKKLRQETSDLKTYLYNIRKDTLKTSKTLEKFDYDGLPATRT